MSHHPASWRMPTPQQFERMAVEQQRQTRPEPLPAGHASASDGWWDSVLSDPRAGGAPWLPIEQRRLSEVPRHLLRVECMKCLRVVELQKADAVKLYGPHAVLKDVGAALLEDGCKGRTGSREDWCWPSWVAR